MTRPALESLLPLPVVFPLCGAVLAPLLARRFRRLPVIVSLVALAGSAAVLLAVAPTVFGGRVIAHYLGHWTPVNGHVLGIAFAAEPFGLLFALAAAIVGAVLLLYTLSELGGLGQRRAGRLRLPVPAAARRADRGRPDRRPVQPVRLVRGRRARQLRADRLPPRAPDRAGGRVQSPGPYHPGELRPCSSGLAGLRQAQSA